ncbi:GNAT family N-acetyltransferase [Amycolatopsis acidiphila]|uniref:GNAT family N-acetyltransferase n=1 Tax=Amycolatopsis acidiphila TaxID=715473 RepID=A0A558AE78_9PSEU|nr:GNAT family N-acetyltransferase [Amycolatopsis acidiphila]TVT22562.1 GNAT family N-acetyltransferase [Amycolatopsis acidiphila]UIJ58802.1 GNAT family N-acetyltransferase [Amycolatopsis acidiphila]GHG72046.1 GNAT family acetyltransferase [Amycolatopsis acidiphila]
MEVFLETARLVLRPVGHADVAALVELDSDPEVMRFLTGGRPTPRAEVEARMLAGGFYLAAEKATGKFVGWFEFRLCEAGTELGYRLRRQAWGKGYATEGARALVDKGFRELGVERVVGYTMTVNRASRRVLEKAGLRYVRTFHPEWPDPIAGAEQGDVEYALLRHDWQRQRPDDVKL